MTKQYCNEVSFFWPAKLDLKSVITRAKLALCMNQLGILILSHASHCCMQKALRSVSRDLPEMRFSFN